MLVHFQLIVPADLTPGVRERLVSSAWTTNVVVLTGAAVDPVGDLIECDVAREKAGVLLNALNELGLDERGGIAISTPTGTPSAAAKRLEAAAPGHPDDAVIWEAVRAEAEDGAQPTLSYLIFLVLAVMLAAIAVITDSAILVVGAMVVGPEFSAIAAACVGIVLREGRLVLRSTQLLVLSFVFAIAVVALMAFAARAVGAIEPSMVTRPRPSTGFIWHPDMWSFVVAIVAGAAGVLALAIQKTATMVGVFISVTTVPAAGNLALGLALGAPGEIWGSLAQLGANVAGMVMAGTLVLAGMRRWWPALTVASERAFGRR